MPKCLSSWMSNSSPQKCHFCFLSIFSVMFLLVQDPGHRPLPASEASAYVTAVDSAFSSLEEHGAPSMDMEWEWRSMARDAAEKGRRGPAWPGRMGEKSLEFSQGKMRCEDIYEWFRTLGSTHVAKPSFRMCQGYCAIWWVNDNLHGLHGCCKLHPSKSCIPLEFGTPHPRSPWAQQVDMTPGLQRDEVQPGQRFQSHQRSIWMLRKCQGHQKLLNF